MAARIRKDDMVVVITGDHKGARGKVLRVIVDKQRVLVEGVNMVYRHVRPSRRNPRGGRLQKEAPIHLSNVLPVDPKTNRPTRVRMKVEAGGPDGGMKKSRMTTKGAVLSEVSRAERS